ncbi:hypothetical protein AOLI_G00325650 [Acnodon oligacanthus]
MLIGVFTRGPYTSEAERNGLGMGRLPSRDTKTKSERYVRTLIRQENGRCPASITQAFRPWTDHLLLLQATRLKTVLR